jgi:hypothetical protein
MHGMRRRGTWLALLTALVMLGVAAPASAAYKPFSLVIATSAPTYDSAAGVTGSGQTVQMTATFTNENTTQQLGSADLGLPASLTATGASLPASSPGNATPATCSSLVTGPCVELRNLSLAPGASVTVTLTVATQACAQGPATWTTEVKQANNFSGTPGNDLNLDTSNSNVTTTLDGACTLAFATQPQSAQVNAPITGTPWTPTGPPVTVQVLNNGGQPVTGSTASVNMSLAADPGQTTLGGTTTAAVDGATGTASFASLTLPASGNGYALSASSGTLSSATSGSFNIANEVQSCITSCSATAGANGSQASVAATAVSTGGLLLESVNANAGAMLACSGYTSIDPNTYETDTTFSASEVITTTIVPPANLTGNANQILKSQQICFGATISFPTPTGTAAARQLPDGTSGFIGLLPNCPSKNITSPCINRQLDTTVPDPHHKLGYDIVLVIDVPPPFSQDPWHT